MANNSYSTLLSKLPPRFVIIVEHALSLMTGMLIALLLHYILYRMSLPGTPFIYVVF